MIKIKTVITSIQSVWVTRPTRSQLAELEANFDIAQKWFCIQNFHMDLSSQEKKLSENPILGCQDIKQKPSLIFLGHPVDKLSISQPIILLSGTSKIHWSHFSHFWPQK